ncbi:MAG: hypothetical protein QM305_01560, partial [Bacteroidota bacterium]|nr:hypothetical protein [Bacteroidota bacterium]
NQRSINLVYSGYGLSDEDMMKVKETALVFQLDTTKIGVISGADAEILKQSTSRYRTEAQELENKLNATTVGLQTVKSQLDSVLNIPTKGEYLLREIRELYPQITACSYSETIVYEDTIRSELLPMVVFKSSRAINRADRNKISSWIETRLKNEKAKTYFE